MISYIRLGYRGRLGNQIFQFSAGVSLAKELNTEFRFPIENMTHSGFDGVELYNCFDLSEDYKIPLNSILEHVDCEFEEDTGDYRFYSDFFNIQNNVNLNGYFPCEKYFSKYSDLIRSELRFRDNVIDEGNDIINYFSLNSPDVVGIHVRRGDYVELGEWIGEEYYHNCISHVKETIPDYKLCVFSDDINWCKKQPMFENQYFIDSNQYVSLYMMTQFKNLIISNSTFSWWGAWLNPIEDKNIIMPTVWLKNNKYEVDVEGWKKI